MSNKHAEVVMVTKQLEESAVLVRKYKRRRGFSSPRCICLSCKSVSIHPNDAQYATKICFRCSVEPGLGAARTPRQPAAQVPSGSRPSAGPTGMS